MQENRDVVDQKDDKNPIHHEPFRLHFYMFFPSFIISTLFFLFRHLPVLEKFGSFLFIPVFLICYLLIEITLTIGLKIKPSSYTIPEKLMAYEGVTPEEFDAYFKSRTQIRLFSFVIATIVSSLFSLFEIEWTWPFVWVYAISTFVGIVYFRFKLHRFPKLLWVGGESPYYRQHQSSSMIGDIAKNKAMGLPDCFRH